MWIIRKQIAKHAPYADRIDFSFGILIFILAAGAIHSLGGSAAIALVSAVTASVAIYQLRKPENAKQPAVRQAFNPNENADRMDFGFRNYGPGPALYLQVEAIFAKSGERIFKIEPREHPMHLSEGEFLGFLHDNHRPNDRLLREISGAEEDEERLDETVYFFYSYVSTSGVREPKILPDKAKKDDENILEDLRDHCEKPREMKLGEISQHYLDKTENHTTTEMHH